MSDPLYTTERRGKISRLVCQLGVDCPYRTIWRSVDDASAQEEFYRHKWGKHEPETQPAQ